MVFPREIIVGHKTLEQCGELCDRISRGNNALIIHDKYTKKIAGNKILKTMKKAGYNIEEKIIKNATVTQVNSVINYANRKKTDILLGVGGGSVIDVSKLASHELGKSFISIPTCASHDGIASPRASLKHRNGSVSKTATSPLAVLGDTEIINKAPYRMLAAGCADVLSNISACLDWKLANRLKNEEYSSHAAVLAETAAQLIIDHADEIKPDVEEAVWFAVKAMIVSGVAMSVAGNTRPASGSEHMFSHMLDHLGPGIMLKKKRGQQPLHGEQCGVGAILITYLHGKDWELIKTMWCRSNSNDIPSWKRLGINQRYLAKNRRPNHI
jgi:glycerol-1-phosphate dehydrogenase [NAD(P)+]